MFYPKRLADQNNSDVEQPFYIINIVFCNKSGNLHKKSYHIWHKYKN